MDNKNKFQRPNPQRPRRRGPKGQKDQPNNIFFWVFVIFLFMVILAQTSNLNKLGPIKNLNYSEFYALLDKNTETGRIQKIELTEEPDYLVRGVFDDGSEFKLNIPKNDEKLLELMRSNVENFSVTPAQTFWTNFLFAFMPVIVILLFIWYISYRGSQVGNKIWSFGKSRAKINSSESNVITFENVAGVDEAKEELQEIIEFLKEPKKFTKLGGKIPKGVLLIGSPGTGKTLLAKAVAGEAGVPFFSLSGSDFVEMFVGVGASRVRDLFDQGRKASKISGKGAIIFIDEIDAVGRLRFAGIGGGNDEREQTLNALLVEMDGFNAQTGVIIMAATNRPDTLDPALLRPGRFDRQIIVMLPDIKGREGILKVHSKNIKLGNDINFKKVAQQTVYFSGADLANVCNEAALLAARKNKEAVGMEEFHAAVERVTMGPEKKNNSTSDKEKKLTAYHEAGHALLSMFLDEVDTFTKVSIIPRGMAGGYTLTPPTEDKHYRNKRELMGSMVVLLGGLVAEELTLGDTSTGVSNDLEKVSSIARAMICSYGMSDKLGQLAFGQRQGQGFLGRDLMEQKDYSDETAKQIDGEIKSLVDQAYNRAKKLLSENQDKLDKLAAALLEKEIMDIDETKELLGLNGTGKSSKKDSKKDSSS